jgi:hypothetical protein
MSPGPDDLARRVAALEADLAAARSRTEAAVADVVSERDVTVQDLETRLHAALAERDAARESAAGLQQRLKLVLASRSWRLTAPLRALAGSEGDPTALRAPAPARRTAISRVDARLRSAPRVRRSLVRAAGRFPSLAERARSLLARTGVVGRRTGPDVAGRRRRDALTALVEGRRRRDGGA